MVDATCPICGAVIREPEGSRLLPFCSNRCRQIDLGRWLSESYRIVAPSPGDPDCRPDPAAVPRPSAVAGQSQ
jgi:endogenous inhibitor of DNA gyrase (YacG/DUF329 family)